MLWKLAFKGLCSLGVTRQDANIYTNEFVPGTGFLRLNKQIFTYSGSWAFLA